MTLAADILAHAYTVVGPDLDHVGLMLHGIPWRDIVSDLEFQPWDTGGGCMMLLANTPWGTCVGITSGEAELPEDVHNYWIGVMNQDDTEELYALQVRDGHIEWKGGELS